MFNCLLHGQDNYTGVHSVHMRDYHNQALLNEWVQRYFAKVQALMHYTLTSLSLHLTLAACADLCRGHRPLQLGCGRECVCAEPEVSVWQARGSSTQPLINTKVRPTKRCRSECAKGTLQTHKIDDARRGLNEWMKLAKVPGARHTLMALGLFNLVLH
jgi:hypothetical protein